MARIPEAAIERIKREVDLVGWVEADGVALVRRGRGWMGLCPLHRDRQPSLVVTPGKGLWHCLGACQTGGSVIDWVMKRRGVGFREAVRVLEGWLGEHPEQALPRTPTEAEPERRGTDGFGSLAMEAADAELVRQVITYYHRTLESTPQAMEYLAKRGLADPELVERFQLGYANRTLHAQLPGTPQSQEREESRKRLQRLGFLRESGHEHFRGSLVVPVITPGGEVVEVYGRQLRKQPRNGIPVHLYLPGPHRGVWNEAALEGAEEIVLCESLAERLDGGPPPGDCELLQSGVGAVLRNEPESGSGTSVWSRPNGKLWNQHALLVSLSISSMRWVPPSRKARSTLIPSIRYPTGMAC